MRTVKTIIIMIIGFDLITAFVAGLMISNTMATVSFLLITIAMMIVYYLKWEDTFL